MACWELESRLKLAMTLHELIAEEDGRRSKQIAPASRSAEQETYVRDMHSLYSEWLATADEMFQAIAVLENQAYHVEGTDRFRQICRHLRGLLQISPNQIVQSLDDLDQRKFRPLAEVRDELRRRPGA